MDLEAHVRNLIQDRKDQISALQSQIHVLEDVLEYSTGEPEQTENGRIENEKQTVLVALSHLPKLTGSINDLLASTRGLAYQQIYNRLVALERDGNVKHLKKGMWKVIS